MQRWIRRIGVGLLGCAALASGIGWWAVRQTRHVPEFYSRVTARPHAQTEAASRRLHADVQQLQRDAAQQGSWRAEFLEEEINAWLIEEMPRTLPRLLASGAREPRVVIDEGRMLAAARFTNHHVDTVISCEVEVELTEQANILALRVSNLRAGALRLPLQRFLKGITKELAVGGIDVQWDLTEAGPVALLSIPQEHPAYVHGPVVVESIEMSDGKLMLAGNTGYSASHAYEPQGPVYRFVTYEHRENLSRQTAHVVNSSGRRGERMR